MVSVTKIFTNLFTYTRHPYDYRTAKCSQREHLRLSPGRQCLLLPNPTRMKSWTPSTSRANDSASSRLWKSATIESLPSGSPCSSTTHQSSALRCGSPVTRRPSCSTLIRVIIVTPDASGFVFRWQLSLCRCGGDEREQHGQFYRLAHHSFLVPRPMGLGIDLNQIGRRGTFLM